LTDDEAKRAVTEEVIANFPGRGQKEDHADTNKSVPDHVTAALKRMRCLDSCVSEALRLASASITVRKVVRAFTFTTAGGHKHNLRAGDEVAVYPFLTHTDPDIYDAPRCYRYDRFLDVTPHLPLPSSLTATTTREPRRQQQHHFLPFGGGSSICPGRYFARNEIKLFLACVLFHFDIALLATDDKGKKRSESSGRDPFEVLPSLDQTRVGIGVLPPVRDIAFRLQRRKTNK
jgi:cytochrome P450